MKYCRKTKDKANKIINDHIILIHLEIYDDGGCQCYKDCDCIKNKGVKKQFINYKHSLSKQTFGSLEEAEDNYQITLSNNNKMIAQIKEAKEWFNSLTNKEQNKMINLFKSYSNNYKKHNHKDIKQNETIIKDIHRSLMKWKLI